MASDSGSLWRPVERIDAVVIAPRGIELLRAVSWTGPCRMAGASISTGGVFGARRRVVSTEALGRALFPDGHDVVVDDELTWFGHDDVRGLQVPLDGTEISIRLPEGTAARPVAEVTRLPRLVTVTSTRPTAAGDEHRRRLRPGRHPGVYTRWPLVADIDREPVLGVAPARIATGPAALFRDSEEHRLVG